MAFETINLGTQPAGTGGDTARSAFEKTNRNFLAAEVLSAAMSQAQFEAIRAQNNEEFAASGFVHFGKHDSTSSRNPINQGLWTLETASNVLLMGRSQSPHASSKSKSDGAIVNVAGVLFELASDQNVSVKQFLIKFPQAPDGKTTYNKSTGVITTHATVTAAFNAQAADPTNVEVVTDRVDMWGFESWLEEVNTTNPYIYPNGLIQSQATTMDGITTYASARPVTYYAVFDGDTGSKGKGLNFFALTDAQKKKVLANPKNNLYYLDDGRLVQWRLRQRTIAGAGNGDWVSVSPVTDSFSVRFSANNDVIPHGILNTTSGRQATQYFYASKNPPSSVADSRFIGDAGVYQIRPSSAELCGINGQCYFLVCGTVNRLNQGLYHPSYNAGGAAKAVGDTFWYNTATSITSKTDCFDATKLLANSGIIASGKSGRPDGRYYDAIYADGQGGVCRDMRYSAYGVDAVDFATADQKVKNGTYRGFENTKFSLIAKTTVAAGSWDYLPRLPAKFVSDASIGDVVYVQSQSGSYEKRTVIGKDASNIRVNTAVAYALDYICILETTKNISIGGSFLQTDVVGNPANILATPQLANGWQGSWIPEIPDGMKDYFTFTRKYIGLGVDVTRTYTSNNGSSWTSGVITLSAPVTNQTQFDNMPSNQVTLYQYRAFAKQTENTVNAVVYGGLGGLGEMAQYAGFYTIPWGPIFAEGLINKVVTSSITGTGLSHLSLIDKIIRPDTYVLSGSGVDVCSHPTVNKPAPNNNSPAVKALNYNVNINQQAFIQYAYTELKHNGSSWGDDGKVTIVDNQATKTDLNGNTVLVGTAKLKEPIGWIKNKV